MVSSDESVREAPTLAQYFCAKQAGTIEGDFSDLTPALSGADGMAFLPDGRLLVAFTSQLNTVTATTADWRAARSSPVDLAVGMTDVIVAEGVPYLLNGQAVSFALGREPEPFELVRFLLP